MGVGRQPAEGPAGASPRGGAAGWAPRARRSRLALAPAPAGRAESRPRRAPTERGPQDTQRESCIIEATRGATTRRARRCEPPPSAAFDPARGPRARRGALVRSRQGEPSGASPIAGRRSPGRQPGVAGPSSDGARRRGWQKPWAARRRPLGAARFGAHGFEFVAESTFLFTLRRPRTPRTWRARLSNAADAAAGEIHGSSHPTQTSWLNKWVGRPGAAGHARLGRRQPTDLRNDSIFLDALPAWTCDEKG